MVSNFCLYLLYNNLTAIKMYNPYTLKRTDKNYRKPAVWKGLDEIGNMVWHTYDAREGDTFHSDTWDEAIKIWLGLMPQLDEVQQNEMFLTY